MYQSLNYIIIRTPTLSFSIQKNYKKVIESPLFQEALYLASPSLYNDIYIHKNNKKDVLSPLTRYINRISTRCTPFGLFAGCSIGKLRIISGETSFIIQKKEKKHIRLDMLFLCKLSNLLSKNKEIQNHIYYLPNSTLYKVGKKIRFIEKNDKKDFQISTVEYSSILNKILNISQYGVKKREIINFLISQGTLENEAIDYVDDLIDSQILISEITPAVTGQDYLSKIIKILNREDILNKESLFVKELSQELETLNSGNNIHSYKHFISLLKFHGLEYDESRLFQVDMTREVYKAEINQKAIKDLDKVITFLCKNNIKNKSFYLRQFTEVFYERYGEREMPLLEALDPEIGLGYPISANNNYLSPLLEGFQLPIKENQLHNSEIDSFYRKLSKKIIEGIILNKEVYLSEDDIDCTEINSQNIPSTIGLMCELHQDKNNNTQIYLKSIGGGCGNNLIARFAYMDQKTEGFVQEITTTEQLLNQDVIYAEISCLPEERMGNILHRPHIRDYEIPILTSSDIPRNKIISLSDLLIYYKNGNLYLKSKKLMKQICPKLTTAHNFTNSSVPVYRFLCDMQTQEPNIHLPLNHNLLLSQFCFIPRIKYGNIILSLATWNVSIKDIKYFFQIQDTSMLIHELNQWRSTIALPQHCFLKDGDNNLYIDWNNFDMIQAAFSIIKKRENIYLTEFLFNPDSALVRNEMKEPYLNECILIFKKKDNEYSKTSHTRK